MEKNKKGFIFMGLFVVLAIIGLVMLKTELKGYSIICFVLGIVLLIKGISTLLTSGDEDKEYERKVHEILMTYDSILVKSNSVPNFEDRDIITLESIDDLIDAQLEIRKPICYVKQTESCSFVLLDEKEAYVYIQKLNEKVESPVEIEIKNIKIRKKKEKDLDSEILKDIDKTTIVKLSNKKSYKVSPIRKKEYHTEILEWLNTSNNEELEEDTIVSNSNTKAVLEDIKVEEKPNKKESVIKTKKDVDYL